MPTPSDIAARKGSRTVSRPYGQLVNKADPDWQKDKTKQPEYDFRKGSQGRLFTGNPRERGAYGEDA